MRLKIDPQPSYLWMLLQDLHIHQILRIQQIIIQYIRPHIVEPLHVLIVLLRQVELDTVVEQERLRDLLQRVPLKVEEQSERVDHLSFLLHPHEQSGDPVPEGGEFEGRDEHPRARLCAFFDELERGLVLGGLFVVDVKLVLYVDLCEHCFLEEEAVTAGFAAKEVLNFGACSVRGELGASEDAGDGVGFYSFRTGVVGESLNGLLEVSS